MNGSRVWDVGRRDGKVAYYDEGTMEVNVTELVILTANDIRMR